MHRVHERGGIQLGVFVKVFSRPLLSSSFVYVVSAIIVLVELANVYGVSGSLTYLGVLSAYYTIGILVSTATINSVRVPGSSIEYLVTALSPKRLYICVLVTASFSSLIVALADTPLVLIASALLLHSANVVFLLLGIVLAIAASATIVSAQALSPNPPVATALILVLFLPLFLRLVKTSFQEILVVYFSITLIALAALLVTIVTVFLGEERVKASLLRLVTQLLD